MKYHPRSSKIRWVTTNHKPKPPFGRRRQKRFVARDATTITSYKASEIFREVLLRKGFTP
jgi:hypothetical protein